MEQSIFLTSWAQFYASSRNRKRKFAALTFAFALALFLGIATLYRWGHSLPLTANLTVGFGIWMLPTSWFVCFRTYLRIQEMDEQPERDENFDRLLMLAFTTLSRMMTVQSLISGFLFLGIAAAGAALSRR